MSLVFMKLGGSAITDKTRAATPRPEVIRAAAQALVRVRAERPDLQILLGHGSGSFGHYAAQQSGFGAVGNWRAFAETGAAAARLNRLVTDILLEAGLPVVSFQPSASARGREGELVAWEIGPVRAALEHALIPLVYGDVAFDETRGMSIASTEKLFAYLVPFLRPRQIIYVSQVDGIYTTDPASRPDAQLIREITPTSFADIEAGVGASHGVDVTGGMLDKVRRNLALVERWPPLEIRVIGAQPEVIERTLLYDDCADGTRLRAGE